MTILQRVILLKDSHSQHHIELDLCFTKSAEEPILERLRSGDISRRKAAKELGIGYATLKRLLDAQNIDPSEDAA